MVQQLLMLNYLLFNFILNFFELFVTQNIVPNFCGKKFPAFALIAFINLKTLINSATLFFHTVNASQQFPL
ncbi:unnamed protein product [Tenebrio molitor]|nr:unnamed protein product [Tenebrio molitor]